MSIYKDLVNWYFAKRSLPYWSIVFIDVLLCFIATIFVLWLFSSASWILGNLPVVLHTVGLLLLIDIIMFKVFHTYAGVIRFSSFVDLKRIGLAMGAACFVAILIHYPMLWYDNEMPHVFIYPLGIRHIVTIYLVKAITLGILRVMVKLVYDSIYLNRNAPRTFIYGIQNSGIGLAKTIRTEKPRRFDLKGFITDDPNFRGKMLMGEKVVFLDDRIIEKLVDNHVKVLLISPNKNEIFRENTALQDQLIDAGIKIYMIPRASEWDNSATGSARLEEVKIEDLLPRSEIRVDMENVGKLLTGKRVLITGSAGSIGSEMVRQIAPYKPSEMVLIDQAETPQHDIRLMMEHDFPEVKTATIVTSICKADRMEHIFKTFRPEYVFHAAAYKHVPMMEDNPCESIQNNVEGTKIIADLSVKYGVKKFVMISTDKAVNPTNVMGCSKRICEIYVQSLDQALKDGTIATSGPTPTQFVTTRFGNVLGSNGSVIPLFRKQLQEGGPLTVTHPDIIRYFMLIPEACKLVLEAGTHGQGGEIFVFDMGKPVRIADLAKRMIKLSGAHGIEIKYTGLRPGEKLYEEVLDNEETTKPSFHEKIRIANVRPYDYNEANQEIEELIAMSRNYDKMNTVRQMKHIVPEYISQNSVYQSLDQTK